MPRCEDPSTIDYLAPGKRFSRCSASQQKNAPPRRAKHWQGCYLGVLGDSRHPLLFPKTTRLCWFAPGSNARIQLLPSLLPNHDPHASSRFQRSSIPDGRLSEVGRDSLAPPRCTSPATQKVPASDAARMDGSSWGHSFRNRDVQPFHRDAVGHPSTRAIAPRSCGPGHPAPPRWARCPGRWSPATDSGFRSVMEVCLQGLVRIQFHKPQGMKVLQRLPGCTQIFD